MRFFHFVTTVILLSAPGLLGAQIDLGTHIAAQRAAADLAYRGGRPDRVREIFEAVRRDIISQSGPDDPRLPGIGFQLVQASVSSGDFDAAAQEARAAWAPAADTFGPLAPSWLRLGDMLADYAVHIYRLGNYQLAVDVLSDPADFAASLRADDLRASVEVARFAVAVLGVYGESLLSGGAPREARLAFEDTLRVSEAVGEANTPLGQHYATRLIEARTGEAGILMARAYRALAREPAQVNVAALAANEAAVLAESLSFEHLKRVDVPHMMTVVGTPLSQALMRQGDYRAAPVEDRRGLRWPPGWHAASRSKRFGLRSYSRCERWIMWADMTKSWI